MPPLSPPLHFHPRRQVDTCYSVSDECHMALACFNAFHFISLIVCNRRKSEVKIMSEAKKKRRQYSVDYIKYGFIENPANQTSPMCLICKKTYSNEAMKPSRLLDHLNRIHPDKKDKDVSYFLEMKKKYETQPTVSKLFSSTGKQEDDGLRASYNISLLIAKAGKPHTIGEDLILPAVTEVITTVLHKPAADIIRKIPLSNSSVQRRIDEMAENIEESLCNHLRTCQFSIQLDESTLTTNEALLYVRFIRDEMICQELLFATNLETDTKGETIFNALEKFCEEKKIPLNNILSVATDGAPAMTGRHKGFIACLKRKVNDVLAVHCVIHRQHLVAKNLSERLHTFLQYVIRAVNKIRSSSLNDRLFSQLCISNDEDFNQLLLHTEVRWLSKGNCLTRFYSLFGSVIEFLENKDSELSGKKTKNCVAAFVSKLLLYKRNIGRCEFNNFPSLSSESFKHEDLLVYCQHLENLHCDFKERFKDILNMEIPEWVLDPFSNVSVAGSSQLEEELIELTTNEELKIKFKNWYQNFWLQKPIPQLYPGLWSIVQRFLVAFPSSYLVERGFSAVATLIAKKRNRLHVTERGDLRLFLSKIEPDISELLKKHQIQPSH